MEYTKNYKLPQWVESDRIMMEDFNQAMADIDAGISQTLTIAEEGQRALEESVAASLEGITSSLGSGGKNCRIVSGSYTGNGKYGNNNPTSLTFDFKPLVVWVYTASYNSFATLLSGELQTAFENGESCTVSWSGNSVSWYYPSDAGNQFNASGSKYLYICIGY